MRKTNEEFTRDLVAGVELLESLDVDSAVIDRVQKAGQANWDAAEALELSVLGCRCACGELREQGLSNKEIKQALSLFSWKEATIKTCLTTSKPQDQRRKQKRNRKTAHPGVPLVVKHEKLAALIEDVAFELGCDASELKTPAFWLAVGRKLGK